MGPYCKASQPPPRPSPPPAAASTWIRRGAHTSVKDLTDSIQQWTDNWNHNPRPFTWHKSADDIFETMASYLQRIPQTGHYCIH